MLGDNQLNQYYHTLICPRTWYCIEIYHSSTLMLPKPSGSGQIITDSLKRLFVVFNRNVPMNHEHGVEPVTTA